MKQKPMSASCKHCGHRLAVNYIGNCANCGKAGKLVRIERHVDIAVKPFMNGFSIHPSLHTYTNKKLVLVVNGLALFGIFIGAFQTPAMAILLGLLGLKISSTLSEDIKNIKARASVNPLPIENQATVIVSAKDRYDTERKRDRLIAGLAGKSMRSSKQ